MNQIGIAASFLGGIIFVLVSFITGYTPFRWLSIFFLYVEAAFQQLWPAIRYYAAGYHQRLQELRRDVAVKDKSNLERIKAA